MTYDDSSLNEPGLVLAMGGTEERLQMVLGQPEPEGYRLLAAREWTVPGESIKFLTPGLKETLDSFGLDVASIDRIACIRGPGSFTGLRLVLAAAEGLAAGSGAKLAGIDYLTLLAHGPAPLLDGTLHVLTYARRGLVYMQSFSVPDMQELHPLVSYSLAEAEEAILKLGSAGFLMGSGLRKNPDFFNDFATRNNGYTLLPSLWDNASPELLLKVAIRANFIDSSIDPIYVRATDAEDNLSSIAMKRGIDPDVARKRLNELQQK